MLFHVDIENDSFYVNFEPPPHFAQLVVLIIVISLLSSDKDAAKYLIVHIY